MTASFNYAVRYQIRGTCKTPLRTGGADGNVEVVLRDHTHHAMIQGASLAGAMREWLTGTTWGDVFFGSEKKAGQLIVSDAIFEEDTEQAVRPRLRINGATGSADQEGKFDVASLCVGSSFSFEVFWMGVEEDSGAIAVVEQMLAAIDAGQIRLGAQKSNGFGHVTLKVKKCSFNMREEADRMAWLDGTEDGVPLTLPALDRKREIIFEVEGCTDSILIKSSSAEHSDSGSVTQNLSEKGKPLLPGSSVKGAIRGRITSIAEVLNCEEIVSEMFGYGTEGENDGRCGQLRFEDVWLSERKQKISRIRINRFTGGVMKGALFSEEPLSSGITLHISVPDGRPAYCGLLVYALRDLALGLYHLGSGASIGRGRIHLETVKATLPDGEIVLLAFDKDGICTVAQGEEIVLNWTKAIGGAEHED